MIRTAELYTTYPGDKGTRYYKYIPSNGVKPLGVIVFLHGSGEIGLDLTMVERNELPKALAVDGIRSGIECPFIVIAPQEEPGQAWYGRAITAIKIGESFGLGKPHFTGLSLGAMALDNIISSMGDSLASAADVAGQFEGSLITGTVEALKKIPTIHYYGTADTQIAYGYSSVKDMHSRLLAVGADSTMIEYPGRGHNIWPDAYSGTSPNGYINWLLTKVIPPPTLTKDPVIETWVEGTTIYFKTAAGKILIR